MLKGERGRMFVENLKSDAQSTLLPMCPLQGSTLPSGLCAPLGRTLTLLFLFFKLSAQPLLTFFISIPTLCLSHRGSETAPSFPTMSLEPRTLPGTQSLFSRRLANERIRIRHGSFLLFVPVRKGCSFPALLRTAVQQPFPSYPPPHPTPRTSPRKSPVPLAISRKLNRVVPVQGESSSFLTAAGDRGGDQDIGLLT